MYVCVFVCMYVCMRVCVCLYICMYVCMYVYVIFGDKIHWLASFDSIVSVSFSPLNACQEGFQYHHAEPSHVMMTYWLPDMPSTLPPNASHQIGIGAFVMNDRREVGTGYKNTGSL